MNVSARLSRVALVAGVAVWLASALILLFTAYPLGHDEAQYAISGSDLLAGNEPRSDWFFISKGMSVLAAPGVLAGRGEIAMRVVPLLFGLGFLLACWQLARRVFDATTACWVVAVLAGSRSYLRFSVELLSDLPAATCLVAATAVIVGELTRNEARWRLVVVAPWLAAALYLRYGSIVPIAILGVGAAVLGAGTIRRRPAPVIATALVFVALLIPHAVSAMRAVGSPWGILVESSGVPPRGGVLDGVIGYVTVNPLAFYGVACTPALIAGLLALRRERAMLLLWAVAIVDLIAIGLASQAQVRYVFYPTALLVVLGTGTLVRALADRPTRIGRAVVGLALAGLVFAWLSAVRWTAHQGDARIANDDRTLAAAAAIRADARGRACYALADRYAQIEWYAGCRGSTFSAAEVRARGALLYVVLDDLRPRELDLDAIPGARRVVLDRPDVIHVIAFEDR